MPWGLASCLKTACPPMKGPHVGLELLEAYLMTTEWTEFRIEVSSTLISGIKNADFISEV